MCPGVGLEAWLRWFVHLSGGVECRGNEQYPAFSPYTLFSLTVLQKWQLGFWSFCILTVNFMGLPWWRSGEESACQCRGHRFEPWSGKIPHAAEQLSSCATTTEPVCHNY